MADIDNYGAQLDWTSYSPCAIKRNWHALVFNDRLRKKLNEQDRFWETKTLDEFTPEEWEALCDGCGKCCLHKLEDADSNKVYYTNIVCRLLDQSTGRCRDYENRSEVVKDCFPLTPAIVRKVNWLPATCAYRLIAEGNPLPWWHSLVSGDPRTVRQMGISVCGKAVSELDVDLDDLEDMVVDWFD
jgi:uncharacterized protein